MKRIGRIKERSQILKRSIKNSGALYFCADFILAHEKTEENNRLLIDSDADLLKNWFLQAIIDAGHSGNLNNHRKLMHLLLFWEKFDDSGEEARKFVRELTKTVEGCIAYINTAVVISYGEESITERLAIDTIEKFTTLNKLSKVLHSKIDVSQLSMQEISRFKMFRKSLELHQNLPKSQK